MDNEYHYPGIDVKLKMIYDGKNNDIISQYVVLFFYIVSNVLKSF